MVENARITLIKGNDPTLVAQSLKRLVDELVGDADRTLMVEEVTEAGYTSDGSAEADLVPLLTAAQTPPFLTERRVVVGRNMGLFTRGEQVEGLVRWLESPTPSTDLILVWEKGASSAKLGAVPKALKGALKQVGAGEIDAAPTGRGRKALLESKLNEAPVRLDLGAKRLIVDTLGDEVGRVRSIIESLVSTYGEGARLGVSEVADFVGSASDIPPWDLTDAIDSGDIRLSLDKLERMMVGGERHALSVMAILAGHYQKALALDGAGIRDEKAAAALLGMKGSTFPAKKAMALQRKMGTERIAAAVLLVADADLDLRGRSAVPSEAIMEVLVARLARLNR